MEITPEDIKVKLGKLDNFYLLVNTPEFFSFVDTHTCAFKIDVFKQSQSYNVTVSLAGIHITPEAIGKFFGSGWVIEVLLGKLTFRIYRDKNPQTIDEILDIVKELDKSFNKDLITSATENGRIVYYTK